MPRILIVDDHLMYRRALRGALESHITKAHVLEADSLESAWKRLEPDGCIDLSLIDLPQGPCGTRACTFRRHDGFGYASRYHTQP